VLHKCSGLEVSAGAVFLRRYGISETLKGETTKRSPRFGNQRKLAVLSCEGQ